MEDSIVKQLIRVIIITMCVAKVVMSDNEPEDLMDGNNYGDRNVTPISRSKRLAFFPQYTVLQVSQLL